MEQNLGGVETLFKKNAQAVIDNANKAYKTAGLSANAYMETVTSFSASLLQSLGGDTKKAANYADRAIIDMSDNANKMGTSMELIQNAYQGFAKQNYSMLDNLKLGYGGTSSEMYRLLQDAAKLNKEFASTAKFSIDSKGHLEANFADITEAIHIVQTEMGITGTTAKEASSTISGSIDSAKAAFDNFLNGSGSPKELAETMVTAGRNILNGLAEIIPRLIETIPETVRLIKESFAEQLSPENLQEMLDSGANILMSILNGILEALPGAINTAVMIVQTLITYLAENLPQFLTVGVQILTTLASGIIQLLPTLLTLGICVNPESDYYKAVDKAEQLAAYLLKQYGWGTDRLKRHYDASRKHCPRRIQDEGLWPEFKSKTAAYMGTTTADKPDTPTNKPTTQTGGRYMFEPKTVKKGDSGLSVLLLQEILIARGLKGKDGKALTLDRVAGTNTIHALKKYQEGREGVLEADGICGEKTWRDLIAL